MPQGRGRQMSPPRSPRGRMPFNPGNPITNQGRRRSKSREQGRGRSRSRERNFSDHMNLRLKMQGHGYGSNVQHHYKI
uniref:Nucleocapsid protein n=1 Tax=Strongyloides papillosus TaxID=174720 RepID=A0A0N5CCR4_STREA